MAGEKRNNILLYLLSSTGQDTSVTRTEGEIIMFECGSSSLTTFRNVFGDLGFNEIKRFCYRINSSNTEVFIVMARKAVCFMDVLVELGLIDNNFTDKLVLTDRVLDLSSTLLLGKKVTIIDDVIISGTTVAKTVSRLIDLGVSESSISIVALATSDTFQMDFTSADGKYKLYDDANSIKFSPRNCVQLSSNVSKALTVVGHPYDIDFPAYDCFVVSQLQLKQIFESHLWECYDVQNRNHQSANIKVYTLLPNKSFLSSIWNVVGIDLNKVAHVKVRIFLKSHIEDTDYDCQIVPMVIFKEISEEGIQTVFDFCMREIDGSLKDNLNCINKPSAKLRFIQFMIAAINAELFFSSMDIPVPNQHKTTFLRLFANVDFETFEIGLHNLLAGGKQRILHVLQCSDTVINMLGYVAPPSPSLSEITIFDVNMLLTAPLNYWYEKKERPTQKYFSTTKNYRDDEIQKGFYRLEQGFSFNALESTIACFSAKYDVESIVSLYIDRAVDFGMIVPIIFKDGTQYSRAYRHGEDFVFTEDDYHKLIYFLGTFFEGISRERGSLGHIATEKIIVLFLQSGLFKKDGFLNGFKNFDNEKEVLSVKYWIHGPVPVLLSQEATDEIEKINIITANNVPWFTRKLAKDGIITEVVEQPKTSTNSKKGNLSTRIAFSGIDKYKTSQEEIFENHKLDIALLAELLSEWFVLAVKNKKSSQFTDYLTALTSCVTEETFASAILAELYIAKLDWEESMVPVLFSNNIDEICEVIRNTRKKTKERTVFTAINSARMKYRWVRGTRGFEIEDIANEKIADDESTPTTGGAETVNDIVEEVKNLFLAEGERFAARDWERMWLDYVSVDQSLSPINIHIVKAVRYAYVYNICHQILEFGVHVYSKNLESDTQKLSLLDDQITSISIQLNKIISEYSKIPATDQDCAFFKEKLESNLLSEQELSNFIKTITNYINERNTNSEPVIDIINDYLKTQKKDNKVLLYKSCILFRFLNQEHYDSFCVGIEKVMKLYFNSDNYGLLHFDEKITGGYFECAVLINKEHPLDSIANIFDNIHSYHLQLNRWPSSIIVIPTLSLGSIQLKAWGNTLADKKKIYTNLFELVGSALDEAKQPNDYIYYLKNTKRLDLDEPNNKLQHSIETLCGNSKRALSPINVNVLGEEYNVLKYKNSQKTIGIITIIDDEARAVINTFGLARVKGTTRIETSFYISNHQTKNGTQHQIYMIRQREQGRLAMQEAYYSLLDECKPDIFIVVGIAGSIDIKNADYGDVIIPKMIIDAGSGKEKDGVFLPEFYADRITASIINIINDFEIAHSKDEFSANMNLEKQTFRCCFDPIIDNGHVISDQDAAIRDVKTDFNRKTTGVDTESSAVAFLTNSQGTNPNDNSIGTLIIRGISDRAVNKPSDNKWHEQASYNAAQICKLLLEYC